ncbi:hypothetical protein DFS34DRAFT_267481 [Phlyctochytrium arcticum]|nr:hypothetical protein DFS34DRAFT_267481 [Phlyctochytrium arcticum]
MTQETAAIKRLACSLVEIVPHAAGVEGIFAGMPATKTKARNRMQVETLEKLTQVKLYYRPETKIEKSKDKKVVTSDESQMNYHDMMMGFDELVGFDSVDDLEEYKAGVINDAVLESRKDTFMETMFDFDMVAEVMGAAPQTNSIATEPNAGPVMDTLQWSVDSLFD